MNMPYMDMYEIGYMSRQSGSLVRKTDKDFRTVEEQFPLEFDGMLTGIQTQTEKTKTGFRQWQGCKLYCAEATQFLTDDIIILPEGRFRVRSPRKWNRNGYNCYELQELGSGQS